MNQRSQLNGRYQLISLNATNSNRTCSYPLLHQHPDRDPVRRRRRSANMKIVASSSLRRAVPKRGGTVVAHTTLGSSTDSSSLPSYESATHRAIKGALEQPSVSTRWTTAGGARVPVPGRRRRC